MGEYDHRIIIDLNTRGSAIAIEPLRQLSDVFDRVRQGVINGQQDGTVFDFHGARIAEWRREMLVKSSCGARYDTGHEVYRCTLAPGHSSAHEDHDRLTTEGAIYSWRREPVHAWLVETENDTAVCGSWNEVLSILLDEGAIAPFGLYDEAPRGDIIQMVNDGNGGELVITELTEDASFDHGRSSPDDIAIDIGIQAAALVTMALMTALTGRQFFSWDLKMPAYDAVHQIAMNGERPEDDDDLSQSLHEWSEEMRTLATDAGWIVDDNVDGGTTTFYRRISA